MNWISLCRPAHCIGALPVCCKGTAARCLTYALTRQQAAPQTCSSDSFSALFQVLTASLHLFEKIPRLRADTGAVCAANHRAGRHAPLLYNIIRTRRSGEWTWRSGERTRESGERPRGSRKRTRGSEKRPRESEKRTRESEKRTRGSGKQLPRVLNINR